MLWYRRRQNVKPSGLSGSPWLIGIWRFRPLVRMVSLWAAPPRAASPSISARARANRVDRADARVGRMGAWYTRGWPDARPSSEPRPGTKNGCLRTRRRDYDRSGADRCRDGAPLSQRVVVLGSRPFPRDGGTLAPAFALFQCVLERPAGGIRAGGLGPCRVRVPDGRLRPAGVARTRIIQAPAGRHP